MSNQTDEKAWREIAYALEPFSEIMVTVRRRYPGLGVDQMAELVTDEVMHVTAVWGREYGAKSALETLAGTLALALLDRNRLIEEVAKRE